ncbi:MFS transporter [Desulfoscipio gibsoniae]
MTKKFFYGWIVLFLCFLALIISLGIRLSFGAFLTSWELEYNVSRGTLSLISAIGLLVYGLFQPIFGRLTDDWGARPVLTLSLAIIGLSLIIIQWLNNIWVLALIYGIMISIGYAGASNVIASAIVIHWFQKRQGFALGFVTSGMAVGQMIIVPLSIYMVDNWQWQVTFLIFGAAVLFVITPLTFLFIRSKPEDIGLRPYGSDAQQEGIVNQNKCCNQEEETVRPINDQENAFNLFKKPIFWALLVPHFFCGFTDLGVVNTHLIPYLEGNNFNGNVIAFSISLLAIFNIIGTIAAGHASDYFSRTRLLAALYTCRVFSLLILLFLPANNIHQLILFVCLFGITDMAPVAIMSSLCAKLFGKFSIGVVIGIISASHQFGAAVGSYLPGVLYDLTGGYDIAIIFSIAALIAIAGSILTIEDKRYSKDYTANIKDIN